MRRRRCCRFSPPCFPGSTPVLGLDEHLAQRRLTVADVEQTQRANDFAVGQRNPEVAVAALVERADVLDIWLSFERDRDGEFRLLNRQDHGHDTRGELRLERDDLDQLLCLVLVAMGRTYCRSTTS
jgi:hypothetical protein